MRPFEVDMFDERINAIQNRAGNAARYVLQLTVVWLAIGYERFANEPQSWFMVAVIVAAFIAMAVEWIFLQENGITSEVLKEQRKKFGQTASVKYELRKQLFMLTLVFVGLIVYKTPVETFPLWKIFIHAGVIILIVLSVHVLAVRGYTGKWWYPGLFRKDRDEKHSKHEMFDERITAVQQKAGRIAWELLLLLLVILAVITVGYPANLLSGPTAMLAGPIALSMLVAFIIERRSGITLAEKREQMQLMTRKPVIVRRYMRSLLWFAIGFGVVLIAKKLFSTHIYLQGMAVYTSIVFLSMCVMYAIIRYDFRSRYGISREELKAILRGSHTKKVENHEQR